MRLFLNCLFLPINESICVDGVYVNLPFGKTTPAFIICVIYFVSLFLIWVFNKSKIKVKLIFSSDFTEGRKIRIIKLMIGTFLGSIVCFYLPLIINEETVLFKIIDSYLIYEPILAIIIIFLLLSTFLTKENKYKHIFAINKAVEIILPISLLANIFCGRIDISYFPSLIVLVFIYIFYYLLLVNDFDIIVNQKQEEKNKNEKTHGPVQDEKQLFPQHKVQTENLVDLIVSSDYNSCSICVSGQWGVGKTSIVNCVEKILKEKDKDNYVFIRINAMEIDNKKSLLNYFMSEVKGCLKDKGIYTGVASEYKKFIASSVGVLTNESIGSIFQKFMFGSEKEYRKEKEELENLLSVAFEKGKIIIIVDDIERCRSDVVRDYLFLIKEVATMKKCVSIFLTDYNLLSQQLNNEFNDSRSNNFLDKFFDYRIDVYDENPADIFNYLNQIFEKENPKLKKYLKNMFITPGTWLVSVIDELDLCINKQAAKMIDESNDKEKENEKLLRLKRIRSELMMHMKNPRKIIKTYDEYKTYMNLCYNQLLSKDNAKEISDFIINRNVGQIVAFLSFVSACFPNEKINIIKEGADYLEPDLYRENNNINDEHDLIIEIAKIAVFEENSKSKRKSSYLRVEMSKFLEYLLEPKMDLYQLVKPFTSQEEEWINAIDNNDKMVVDVNWNQMVEMILIKLSNVDTNFISNQKKMTLFEKLLKHASDNIEMKKWSKDKLLSIIEYDKKGRKFASGNGVMQIYWEYIKKINFIDEVPEKTKNIINYFAKHYLCERISSTVELLNMLFIKDEVMVERIYKYDSMILNSDKTFKQNINDFLDKYSGYIQDLTFKNKDEFDKLENLTNYIYKTLERNELLKYSDIKKEAEHMKDSANELCCLNNIIEHINMSNNYYDYLINETIYYDTNEIIKNLQELINSNQNVNNDLIISNYFDDLVNDNVELNEEQVEQLHNLVSKFSEKSGYNCMNYHKILCKISYKNNVN